MTIPINTNFNQFVLTAYSEQMISNQCYYKISSMSIKSINQIINLRNHSFYNRKDKTFLVLISTSYIQFQYPITQHFREYNKYNMKVYPKILNKTCTNLRKIYFLIQRPKKLINQSVLLIIFSVGRINHLIKSNLIKNLI